MSNSKTTQGNKMTVNIDASLEFIFPTPIVKATLPLDAQDILESYYAPHIPTTKMGRVTKQNDEDQKSLQNNICEKILHYYKVILILKNMF